nr:coat protein [Penicillium oxalicum partitivirus 1]
MPGPSSQVPSTLAPSDSASAAGSKRSKPGKAERAARRATGSQIGKPADSGKAMTFASGGMSPKPTPGKYPVVFQTGAGEPSRDQGFVLDPNVLASTVNDFPDRFTYNSKYCEFLSFSDLTDQDFSKQLKSASLLRLAQQIVHAHVNMGLPQGDFAPVASTEIRVPGSMSAYLSQFGEFSVPALGTRFLYDDYPSLVKSLVWTADRLINEDDDRGVHILRRSWLPVSKNDGHTKSVIAAYLRKFMDSAEVTYQSQLLEKAVLSGSTPESWDDIKGIFGGTPEKQDRFDFLFKAYADAPSFVTAFTTAAATAVLKELGLKWDTPSASHVDWSFNVKESFVRLSDEWARKSAAYAQFFEMSSSQANRAAATGSQSQMASVSTTDSVTVVKTHLALSAPEFSLVACFPASCLFSGDLKRNVVVTTPLSVRQRATEFVQLDWR